MRNQNISRKIAVIHNIKFVRDTIVEALIISSQHFVMSSFSKPSDAIAEFGLNIPDVIILDVANSTGVEFIEEILSINTSVSIVVWGLPMKKEDIIFYAKYGVAGYVTSEDTTSQLIEAVNGAFLGELQNPKIGWILNQHIHNSYQAPESVNNVQRLFPIEKGSDPSVKSVSLTAREVEVVEWIDKGLSNKEIARELKVELSTVKNHVHSILGKFRVNRRIMAAAHYRLHSKNQKFVRI